MSYPRPAMAIATQEGQEDFQQMDSVPRHFMGREAETAKSGKDEWTGIKQGM
ncbi:MAG: hypothetical protein ABI727_04035 [Nitrosospira sp.]